MLNARCTFPVLVMEYFHIAVLPHLLKWFEYFLHRCCCTTVSPSVCFLIQPLWKLNVSTLHFVLYIKSLPRKVEIWAPEGGFWCKASVQELLSLIEQQLNNNQKHEENVPYDTSPMKCTLNDIYRQDKQVNLEEVCQQTTSTITEQKTLLAKWSIK